MKKSDIIFDLAFIGIPVFITNYFAGFETAVLIVLVIAVFEIKKLNKVEVNKDYGRGN